MSSLRREEHPRVPLFLCGSKKLGWLDLHPGMSEFERFRLECFDRLVDGGLLEKQHRLVKTVEAYRGRCSIHREVRRGGYRRTKSRMRSRTGMEDGVPRSRMLGILRGYTEEENRCWTEDCIRRNIFPSGMRLYCVLTAEEASFVQNAAFRLLPWSTCATLLFHDCPPTPRGVSSLVEGRSGGTGVVKVVVPLLAFRSISSPVSHADYRVAQEHLL